MSQTQQLSLYRHVSSKLKMHLELKSSNQYRYQIFATFATLIPVIITGIHVSWTSVYIPKLLRNSTSQEHIEITSDEGGWLAICINFGGLLGSVISFTTLDKLGRKLVMLVTAVPYLVASILLAFYSSFFMLCIARSVIGLASAVTVAVIPLYLGEIAHPKIRGYLQTNYFVFEALGTLIINVAGWYLTIKTTSLLSASIIVIFVLVFVWLPESPYYLLMAKKEDEARASLRNFRNANIDAEFERIKDAVKTQIENGTNFKDVFLQKSNRKALWILFLVLNGKQFVGDWAIDAYAQTIFEEISSISPLLMSVLFYVGRILMIILTSVLIDKIGRRILLLVSFFTLFLSLAFLGVYLFLKNYIENHYFHYVAVFAILIYALSYCFVIGIPVVLLGELFPMNVKANVTLLFSLYYFLTVMITVKFFQFSSDVYGMYVPFLAFSLSCLVHWVLIYFVVFETKGKTLEEIQLQLHNSAQ